MNYDDCTFSCKLKLYFYFWLRWSYDFFYYLETVLVIQTFFKKSSTKSLWSIKTLYRKAASSRLSWLVALFHIFRLFIKGNFDSYVLWTFDKIVQNWIVDWYSDVSIKNIDIRPNRQDIANTADSAQEQYS
jgi:hypothetical protein